MVARRTAKLTANPQPTYESMILNISSGSGASINADVQATNMAANSESDSPNTGTVTAAARPTGMTS